VLAHGPRRRAARRFALYGYAGMHAAKGTNFLLEEADLLLAIGARLTIAPPARWPSSVRKPRSPTSTSTLRRSGRSSPPSTLWSAMPQTSSPSAAAPDAATTPAWRARATELRAAHRLAAPPRANEPLHPVISADSSAKFSRRHDRHDRCGQHQMWVAQAYPVRQPRTLLTSAGLAPWASACPLPSAPRWP